MTKILNWSSVEPQNWLLQHFNGEFIHYSCNYNPFFHFNVLDSNGWQFFPQKKKIAMIKKKYGEEKAHRMIKKTGTAKCHRNAIIWVHSYKYQRRLSSDIFI